MRPFTQAFLDRALKLKAISTKCQTDTNFHLLSTPLCSDYYPVSPRVFFRTWRAYVHGGDWNAQIGTETMQQRELGDNLGVVAVTYRALDW